MVTQVHNIRRDTFTQENEFALETAFYPVDLSLLHDISQTHPGPGDSSTAFSVEKGDPLAIAQCALVEWNRYLASREEKSREVFLRAAQWLVDHVQRSGGGALGWPLAYAHPLYFTQGHWLSSIVQGCGLSVLARVYSLTGEQCFVETAHLAARTFESDILDGGVSAPIGADGVFFEEVAVYPASHTLNGSIFALLGLYDYAAITGNVQIQQLIQRGEATLHSAFNEFDLGFWTRVDLLRCSLATPAQLAQQIALLKALAGYSKCSHCSERVARWQQYHRGRLSRLRYIFARRKALIQQALLKRVRTIILSHSQVINPQSARPLSVCVPVSDYPSPGGVRTFLDQAARVMADRWQMEYITQYVWPDVGERVIHQFGRPWMTPWHFPQNCLYVLAGARKLLSLMYQGANYGLILPQDGVFSGAFAALVGKLTGVRVVCFDHSTLTWYRSQAYQTEVQGYLDRKVWPWTLRQLVQISRFFYWPSLCMLARFATAQANHLLSPGVFGDEIDEICRDLQIPLSHVTRCNLTINMQGHVELSAAERAARRISMNIPPDALIIAMTVRLDREKGLDISVESISRALSLLPPKLRNRVRVMIAGDGELQGWLEEQISQRGLSSICRMLGHISNEKIHSLLAVSDISLHTSTRCACMPTAVLEGMAAGCAVIASSVPLATVHMLAEGRGIVVPVGDVEQTSKALEHLLRDSELRDRLGKAAREHFIQHHSSEIFRRALLRVSYWSDLDQLLEPQTESFVGDQ